jgi:hypothetical protein
MSENSDNQHFCKGGVPVKMAAGTELQKNGCDGTIPRRLTL